MSQSVELMAGTENLFVDVQWLKQFEQEPEISLFSRTRATDDYENNVNLFSGVYLSYTSTSSFGGTVVGRMSSSGSGLDTGVHFFKGGPVFLIYALASLSLVNNSGFNWFSITRFTPKINDSLNGFAGLELFSSFNLEEHQFSTQRVRAGLEKNLFQFGFALNLSQSGDSFTSIETNPGIFFRTEF
ncbi:MAG: hypothetical protein ACMZ7B_02875 [Balneola sp.]